MFYVPPMTSILGSNVPAWRLLSDKRTTAVTTFYAYSQYLWIINNASETQDAADARLL